jgi:uncharacterized OB-fold protein
MKSILAAAVKRLRRTREHCILHECRHCGTTVGYDNDRCPECDSRNIAQYEIA